jgi:hypothetical protein
MALVTNVYRATRTFSKNGRYGLTSQFAGQRYPFPATSPKARVGLPMANFVNLLDTPEALFSNFKAKHELQTNSDI